VGFGGRGEASAQSALDLKKTQKAAGLMFGKGVGARAKKEGGAGGHGAGGAGEVPAFSPFTPAKVTPRLSYYVLKPPPLC
jgi:hypothetical protein